ncbi:hypothetical protein DICPUDRAFT_150188 [Dictyostelium purpureum]|uniref:Auto-transporter adhesin head GIN domain-containing protein n=1 Tax=Dictyostelium purpureum TaxID=5786 RepID=F0ZFN7_DICPU|nr:uncharacterized protein DICPUDRAFT_150188 [Dictyostelium purpureum]EGC37265.1 hypothetical protein DICPUDRAFT_150188 [Dictyostelium purpureum]|eukprot:XP_003286235.1 hypothetical protein DICPUDRAFT_150188 [Dictyostelium purpureum]
MKYYLFFIFLIINNINSFVITFNNSVISECTSITPCDLSKRNVWENNEAPIDGDDVLIDLSSYSVKYSIYLVANRLDIELSSFTLYGQQQATDSDTLEELLTYLTINNSNLTIINQFNIQNSVLNINEKKVNNNKISINNLISNQTYTTLGGFLNIECNTTQFEGGSTFTEIIGDTNFTVNSDASFDSVILHSSSGFFTTMGTTYFTKEFFSSSIVHFGGNQTIFSSLSTINTMFLGGQMSITSGVRVTVNNYIQLNSRSSIAILQKSQLYLTNSINNKLILNEEIVLLDNSFLYIQSGFIISKMGAQMNGTIIIGDANDQTAFSNIEQPFVNILSQGNVTLFSSTFNHVNIISNNAWLNIESSSFINSLSNQGVTNIYSGVSLTLSGSSSSSTVNLAGTLTAQSYLNAHAIYINNNGALYSNDKVDATIYSTSGDIYFNSPNSTSFAKSISIQESGTLTLNKPSLYIQNNFAMDTGSLQISSVQLNSFSALIQIDGYANIGSISFVISLNNGQIKPRNHDTIILFSTNHTLNNLININETNIKFSNLQDVKFNIIKDSTGNINLVFYESSSFSTWKIIVIVLVGCAVIILSIISAIYFIKKRKNSSIGEEGIQFNTKDKYNRYNTFGDQ